MMVCMKAALLHNETSGGGGARQTGGAEPPHNTAAMSLLPPPHNTGLRVQPVKSEWSAPPPTPPNRKSERPDVHSEGHQVGPCDGVVLYHDMTRETHVEPTKQGWTQSRGLCLCP